MSDTGMKYVTIIKPGGEVIQQVLARGEHLCENIYVQARNIGTIISDEEIDDGDCTPVFETGHVGTGD